MKKMIYIIVLLISQIATSQQFNTVDLHNYPGISYGDNGYYFKDTQGYFNQFLGTWQYSFGDTTIQLKFVKKTFVKNTSNDTYKTDALIGGIKIVKNGIELVNTLSSINNNLDSETKYYIYDGYRYKNTPDCMGCTVPNQRLKMYYKEPNNDNQRLMNMYFVMHIYKNGQQIPTLRLVFPRDAVLGDPTQYDEEVDDAPTKTQVYLPFGTFDFQKVN
ncbi:DUF6705 family protein [Paenimyroides ceti]